MQLTRREKLLIICALHAVAPSGGGSDEFHLANKLDIEWNMPPAQIVIGRMQMTAHDEIAEQGVDIPAAREYLLTRGM